MVLIPDYSQVPTMSREEYAAIEAEMNAEIAASQAARLQDAWNELQSVPSYLEAQARAFASEA